MKKIKIIMSLLTPASIIGTAFLVSSCSPQQETPPTLSTEAQEYLDKTYGNISSNYTQGTESIEVSQNLQTTHKNLFSIFNYQSNFYNSTKDEDHYFYDESTMKEIWGFISDFAKYENEADINKTGDSLLKGIQEPNWRKDLGFKIKNFSIKYKVTGSDNLSESIEINKIEGAQVEYVMVNFFLEHDAIGSKTGSLEFKYKIDIVKNEKVLEALNNEYIVKDGVDYETLTTQFKELKSNAENINSENATNFVQYWNTKLIESFDVPHLHNNIYISLSDSNVDENNNIVIKIVSFNELIEMTSSPQILFIRYTQDKKITSDDKQVSYKRITFKNKE